MYLLEHPRNLEINQLQRSPYLTDFTMPRRPCKTDHGITDINALVKAIKEVKLLNRKTYAVAREYNIPHSRLYRYITKLDKKNLDISNISAEELLKLVKEVTWFTTHQMVFKDDEEEEALVGYLLRYCNHYYGLSITELRQLTYQLARRIHVHYPESWDEDHMVGYRWFYGLMGRHRNLALRTTEQMSMNRVNSFCRENVGIFFGNLRDIFTKTSYRDDFIYNMDGIGFSSAPSKVGKIISLKGGKYVGHITAQECGAMVTMALAVNAAGNSIPPFFLFPSDNMNSPFMDDTEKNAIGIVCDSGWMQQSEFIKFLEHFIEHSHSAQNSPTLLLVDNHAAHLSVEVIDFANTNGIIMLSFPPNCSHRMQPLDISIYGQLKNNYALQYQAWSLANAGKVFELRHIVGLVTIALEKTLIPQNVKNGFKNAGIYPFNPAVFTDDDFVQANLSDKNVDVSTVENEYRGDEQRDICMSIKPFEFSSGLKTPENSIMLPKKVTESLQKKLTSKKAKKKAKTHIATTTKRQQTKEKKKKK